MRCAAKVGLQASHQSVRQFEFIVLQDLNNSAYFYFSYSPSLKF